MINELQDAIENFQLSLDQNESVKTYLSFS